MDKVTGQTNRNRNQNQNRKSNSNDTETDDVTRALGTGITELLEVFGNKIFLAG